MMDAKMPSSAHQFARTVDVLHCVGHRVGCSCLFEYWTKRRRLKVPLIDSLSCSSVLLVSRRQSLQCRIFPFPLCQCAYSSQRHEHSKKCCEQPPSSKDEETVRDKSDNSARPSQGAQQTCSNDAPPNAIPDCLQVSMTPLFLRQPNSF